MQLASKWRMLDPTANANADRWIEAWQTADNGDAFTGVVHLIRLEAPNILSNGLIVLLYL